MPLLELPELPRLDIYYGGAWHAPKSGERKMTDNPGNGKDIAEVAFGNDQDAIAALEAAHAAWPAWRATAPTERGRLLRKAADIIREHAQELALLDTMDTGNPISEMLGDARMAAANIDYMAGLIPMIKGETIPQSDSSFHYTVREPLGVVCRIVAYNHPFMFAGAKLAAPLAAGCTVCIKPPEQAPLSCLRLAELIGSVFPPGVLNIVPGGRAVGETFSTHPLVKKVTLIGSIPTGIAIQKAAAARLTPTLLELGGKNAFIAFPDADPAKVADAMVRGENYVWSGQSCGSMSRVFLHASLHDKVLELAKAQVEKQHVPGVPHDTSTTMGPLVSKAQRDKVFSFIDSANKEGARLVTGGKAPETDATRGGYFCLPTIFADVKPSMKLAREEAFGPVQAVFKWENEESMWEIVNSTDYGLTGAIFTNDIATAQRAVQRIQTGYVWVNQVSRHYLGVPFGGVKLSGFGREECLDELLSFTAIKSVNMQF